MSKGNTFENDLGKIIFQATAIANIADNAATAPLTNLYIALHTADPGEAGDQTTSEATYTGYARVAVARTSGGWTVTNNVITNAATITFGPCTAGSNSITHWSVGVAASAASKILYSGPVGAITAVYDYTAVASTDILTIPSLTPVADDRYSVYPVEGAAPGIGTGLTAGTVYFAVTVSGSTTKLSLTSGGAAVDITADGSGLLHKHSILAVSSGITPSFATGQLQITEG
jgi:hypothetical protein